MKNIMREIWGTRIRREGEDATVKDKCAWDLKLFAETYLPHVFSSPWSQFHLDSMHLLENIFFENTDQATYDLIIAPRGHSKSSVFSFLSIIHACCYQTKKFILLISATTPAAKQFITDIKNELEYNELIRKEFGDLKDNALWNATDFHTRGSPGVNVCGRGSGAQVRGLKLNGGSRPDLIIVDDLETADDVASTTMSDQLEKWFNSDLLPCGAAGKASYIVVGTILAYNSLLNKMLTEPRYSMWRRKKYTAVMSDSTDTDDWLEWERIMLDGSRKDSYTDAYEYYEKHKEEMMKGVKVLWPEQRKDMYLYLMTIKLMDEEAYNTEYLNSPISERTRTFKDEWINSNLYDEIPIKENRIDIDSVSIAIDPSLGKTRTSDTSAIIALGRCMSDGNIYVLDASVAVRKTQDLITDIENIIKKWYSYDPLVTIETNVFQSFFASTIDQSFKKKGVYVKWNEVSHNFGASKEQRILSLVPHIKNGHLKFPREGARVLKAQLRNWPRDKDDGPDALEMAMRPLLDLERPQFSFVSVIGSVAKSRKLLSDEEKAMNKIAQSFGIKEGW